MQSSIKVKIYQPTKNAMQSGTAKDAWFISFPVDETKYHYSLMNWPGSEDMLQELGGRLKFPSKEEAIKFAERKKWQYKIIEPKEKIYRPKSYAENFK